MENKSQPNSGGYKNKNFKNKNRRGNWNTKRRPRIDDRFAGSSGAADPAGAAPPDALDPAGSGIGEPDITAHELTGQSDGIRPRHELIHDFADDVMPGGIDGAAESGGGDAVGDTVGDTEGESPGSAAESAGEDVSAAESETEIVGVRFKAVGKTYYFAPGEYTLRQGERVIVETSRGVELGEVTIANKSVPSSEIIPPLRAIIRPASGEDLLHAEENKLREREAAEICAAKIAEHRLKMKLVDVEYTFDNTKLLFYFTSEGRIDFRELVKDLASVFRTRIELRQIGIRDEAKIMGGLGICGRKLCCASFLSDFTQVSIKMAKEQNLSLNSVKISGNCGRLMCCLRYEQETYEEELKKTPPPDSVVRTPDGMGMVIETSPLSGMVRVRFTDKTDAPPKVFHRDDVTVVEAGSYNQTEPGQSAAKTEQASAAAGQKTGMRRQRTEDRNQRTDQRGQGFEHRGQRTEQRRKVPDQRGQGSEPRDYKFAHRGQSAEQRGKTPRE